MARHESEMHRHKRELLEALRKIEIECRAYEKDTMATLRWRLKNAHQFALSAIAAVQPPCDTGLFGDHSQMDLADRKDLA